MLGLATLGPSEHAAWGPTLATESTTETMNFTLAQDTLKTAQPASCWTAICPITAGQGGAQVTLCELQYHYKMSIRPYLAEPL